LMITIFLGLVNANEIIF